MNADPTSVQGLRPLLVILSRPHSGRVEGRTTCMLRHGRASLHSTTSDVFSVVPDRRLAP